MKTKEDLFDERFAVLNARQQEAVKTVQGAVMVIAGPGTGKTEVLSMRIANLLRSEAQVQPYEILCLTYTDEATNAMRRRLIQIIGTEAHRVNIFTFHAFCNNVIQNNLHYFTQVANRAMMPITDLERSDLLYALLDGLPSGHKLRRLSGNLYTDTSKLSRLFDYMKKEHLSPEVVSIAIDEYLAGLPLREEYIYKRNGKGFQKGDIKQNLIDEENRRMETTRAAAFLYDDYQRLMTEAGRYDFNDMILWVLDAFRQEPSLLQSYQERYQFILVDEFQDTNGAQNELLTILTSYWDDPNIFVVGDDDQGIFEFQGARLRNIIDFYQRYRETIRIIVLPENYRSSQAILDSAMATIQNNKQRLIYQLEHLHLNKNLVSSHPRFGNKGESITPVIKVYTNVLQEEADVVAQIDTLHKMGVALKEIAIIYAQHKQADNLMAVLERKGIPFNAKKTVNILDEPLINQLLNILRYLDLEKHKEFDGEEVLFELMHSPFLGINPLDIAQLALYVQANTRDKKPLRWKMVIDNHLLPESLGLSSAEAIRRLSDRLNEWETQQTALPLPLLVEKMVYESGIVARMLTLPDHVWHIQVLYTFFEFIKETSERHARIKIREFLQIIHRMNSESIAIPVQRLIQNENGVHFFTAHSAKGHEFEYVFLIGCTKNFWEEKRGSNNEYRLPDTITVTKEDPEASYKIEVARRLFYVAMTRAKKHLSISYALADNLLKPLVNTVFIDEISLPEERMKMPVLTDTMLKHMQIALTPVDEVKIKMANGAWIDKTLQQFTMSYTTLSKYLRCPITFYYENILRVPFQKNDALAFGSAVHYALEKLFVDMKARKGTFPDKEQLFRYFDRALHSEAAAFTDVQFERRLEQGHTILGEYYDHNIESFSKDVEIEFNIPRYILGGVPVTGKIDKIELDGDECTVVDYKTGDPDKSGNAMVAPPSERDPNGGDYWRQMVFYKLLIENFKDRTWTVKNGMFDYLQKSATGEYKRISVPVFIKDEEFVLHQLKDVYGKIMNHEFDRGCGKETCRWCNFARQYELLQTDENSL